MTPEQKDMFKNPLTRARELKAKRRFDEARVLLESLIGEDPGDLKAKASLADLYYRLGDYRKALGLAGAIMKDYPDDPRALVVMGNVLRKRKKPREALEYFRLALNVAPTDYLWLRAAACHLDLKEPNEALQALDAADAIAAGNREGLRLRARVARMLNYSRAEKEIFKMAAQAAPGDEEGFAAFVAPLLADLPPRKAVLVSEEMRQQPGQEINPHLLLLEARFLHAGRDPAGAKKKLDGLLEREIPDSVREEAGQLIEKVKHRLHTKDGPG